ncbi:MAG: insulinase family protein [Verrucomicrobiota bacterium]|nr:insulinase family protein [Verrucomicrobiota bacterium]
MKPLQILFALFAVASSTIPLHAGIDRARKPEPGPAPEASFPDYAETILPNGLKVFVIEDERKPTITFRLLVKAGTIHDGEKAGLATLAAGLLNRGTKTRDAATFAYESDYIGIKIEASAGKDAIGVVAGGLTKYTDQILALLTDAVFNPTFPEDQLERLRKQTLSKLAAERQEPDALGGKLMGKLVFGPHPYGAYRTPESIKSIAREDVLGFHKTWFAPNHASLAVVGDVKTAEILPTVEKAFGRWERKDVPRFKFPAPGEMKGVTVHLVDRPGSVQSNIIVCQPGPARNSPDTPELNVVNATLGGGFSGRLFQNLREKNAWTYGAYSAFGLNKDAGSFQASAEVRNEVTDAAAREILAEMKRLREEPVPDPELELQRQYNVGNYLLSLEDASRNATRVQDIDLYNLPKDFYKRYAKRMASVTPSVAQELARKYLSVEDTAIVVVGEAREIQEKLAKFGKVTVYDTDLKPKN